MFAFVKIRLKNLGKFGLLRMSFIDSRMNSRRELIVMEALAGQPDNIKLLLELGTIRIESNHPDEALEVLLHARNIAPKNTELYNQIKIMASPPEGLRK